MDRYDKDEVKLAARGRWTDIFQSIGGVAVELLDGKHHPCPKCGGQDRFRLIDEQDGALHCNKCFSTRNGDGIAAVMWLIDCTFGEAVTKLAEYLGVKPTKKKRSKKPDKDLAFEDWNDSLAGLFCLKKKPIKPIALITAGAKLATYLKQYKVVALPIWREEFGNVVGWALYNITGGTLPGKKQKDGSYDQLKVKTTYGSSPGLIGRFFPDRDIVFKTEGPSDMLALLGISSGAQASFVCNASGAKENPANNFGWLPPLIDGKQINIVHDCDQPGQDGATYVGNEDRKRPGWAPWLADNCPDATVKNIVLPYPIEETHGKDLRDWITDGGDFVQIKTLASDTEPFKVDESVKTGPVIFEADDDPHRLARLNLKQYEDKFGGKLVFWREEFWKYKAGRYQKIETGELKAKTSAFVRKELEQCWIDGQDKDRPMIKVTRGLINNVIGAMESMVALSSNIAMPCWLPTRERRNLLPMRNGLLDLDSLESGRSGTHLLEHTSDWFDGSSLDFKYDADAECPNWLKFVREVLEDRQQIGTLQMWFGYCLTLDTSQQKILYIIGQPRSGKSTIVRILTSLLGSESVCSPTLAGLADQFGLEGLLGRKLATVTDCRLSSRSDSATVAERLLSISGEDMLSIPIKYRAAQTVKLDTRIMIVSNELFRVADASGALASRMIVLETPNSFQGREDTGLTKSLLQELPGILNWSILGLLKLRRKGKLSQPEYAADGIAELTELASPVSQFVADCCEITPEGEVLLEKIYDCYLLWSKDQGRKNPSIRSVFGRDLKAFVSGIKRIRTGKQRAVGYSGVQLNERWRVATAGKF